MWDSLDLLQGFSVRHPSSGNSQLCGYAVSTYHCPSAEEGPLESMALDSGSLGNGPATDYAPGQRADYVGISGAYPDPAGREGHTLNRGIAANHGVFIFNEYRGMEHILDGTSNTFVIGEQGAKINNEAVKNKFYYSSNYNGCWWGAAGSPTDQPNITLEAPAADLTGITASGITTVRYQINIKSITSRAVISGGDTTGAANTPFTSEHAGGVQFCSADGSVRFVSETVNFDSLKQMCTCDDGMATSL